MRRRSNRPGTTKIRESKKATGIVIRRHILPDSDLILTLLCPEGKIKLIARSGANTQSRTVSKLNLFQHLSVQYLSKPGDDLGLLIQTQLEGALPKLPDPSLYPYAGLLCELCDTLWLEGQDAQLAFPLLAGALRGLCFHEDPEWVALVMAFKLLGVSGHAPRLTWDTQEALPRFFNPSTGGLEASGGVGLPESVALFLTEVYARTVRELMDFVLEGEERALLWRLLERFCTLHVGTLKSWLSLTAPLEGRPEALSATV